MMFESKCSWCASTIPKLKLFDASFEERILNCCSLDCAKSQSLQDRSYFLFLQGICAQELKQGISEERVYLGFHSPRIHPPERQVLIVKSALSQIANGVGCTIQNPLTSINVDGLGSTLRYLNMNQQSRATEHKFVNGTNEGALDLIRFTSVIHERHFHVFNFCEYSNF